MVSPQTLKHLLCVGTVPDTLLLPSQPYCVPQLPFKAGMFKSIIEMRKLDPSPAGLKAGPRDRGGFSHDGKRPLRCLLSRNSFPLASPDTQRLNVSQRQVLPAEAAVAVG